MASISTSKFSVHKQASAGTTIPNADFYDINVAQPGVSGGPANQTVESQLIRASRNPPGVKLVGPSSALTIPWELQIPNVGSTEGWWELLMASIYAAAATPSAQQTSASWSTTTITVGSTTGFEVGDVVRVTTGAGDRIYARVTATTSTTLTVDVSQASPLTGLTVKRGVTVKNGATQQAFAMLRQFDADGDGTLDRFELFNEETVDSATLNLTNKGIITGTFGTVGVGSGDIADTILGTGLSGTPTFAAATSNEVVDATNNVPWVSVAGAEYAVQTINLSWNNNGLARSNVGQFLADGISAGDFRGSGSFTAYFDDFVEFNKALGGTASAFYFVAQDTSGNALVISLPRIRYGNPTLNGQDRDVIASLPFQFEQDSTESLGIRISIIN